MIFYMREAGVRGIKWMRGIRFIFYQKTSATNVGHVWTYGAQRGATGTQRLTSSCNWRTLGVICFNSPHVGCQLACDVGRADTMVPNMFHPGKYPRVVRWVRAIWLIFFKIFENVQGIRGCGFFPSAGYMRENTVIGLKLRPETN